MKSGALYALLTVSLRSQNTSYSQSRCLPHLRGKTNHTGWLGGAGYVRFTWGLWTYGVSWGCCEGKPPSPLLPRSIKTKKKPLAASVNRDASAIKPSHYSRPSRKPWGNLGQKQEAHRLAVSPPQPPQMAHLGRLRIKKPGMSAPESWGADQRKGMVSVSLDPRIFSYTPKC